MKCALLIVRAIDSNETFVMVHAIRQSPGVSLPSEMKIINILSVCIIIINIHILNSN